MYGDVQTALFYCIHQVSLYCMLLLLISGNTGRFDCFKLPLNDSKYSLTPEMAVKWHALIEITIKMANKRQGEIVFVLV